MKSRLKRQSGFGLVVALVIIGFVAGILTTFYSQQSGEILRKEAEIAGWEGAEIARATRIFSRNQIRDIPDLVTQLSIPADGFGGGGPRLIDPDDIILAGLLPQGFARNDGTNFINALGQTVRVYLANYPIDGNPTNPATVPTAYVIFNDNNQTNARLMQDVVSSIRLQDVAVSTPIFNGGVNITGACDGGEQTVALWDSGCLDENDYDLLIDGVDDGDNFVQGSFIIPAWRSASFDSRAVMRFPQPEQPDTTTMLTHLKMGDSLDCDIDGDGVFDDNLLEVPGELGTFASNICNSMDDDSTMGAAGDFRRSIENTANITDSFGLVIHPQTGNNVNVNNNGIASITGNAAHALRIQGTLTGTGDALVYQGNTDVGGTLIVDKNIRVTSDNPTPAVPASARINILNANNTVSDNLRVANRPNFANDVGIRNSMENVSTLTSSGEYTSDIITLNATGTNTASNASAVYGDRVRVRGDATISGTIESSNIHIQGTSDVSGSLSGFSFATAKLTTDDVTINNNVSVSGRVNMFATTNTDRIDVTNNGNSAVCLGDCPRRAITEECNSIRDGLGGFPGFGYGSYDECINQ